MKPILYSHGGSKNHGCEAIVRTLAMELSSVGTELPVLVSMRPDDDFFYKLNEVTDIKSHYSPVRKLSFNYVKAYFMNKLLHKFMYLDCLPCVDVIKQFDSSDIAFSIGGDNYSYHFDPDHAFLHNLYRSRGLKTILWACSINPELIKVPEVLKDLRNFDCITARESITYQAMLDCGLANVRLIPDLAFILPRQECCQSRLINDGKFVGLNLSPMVINYGRSNNLVLDNYRQLITFLINNTDYCVALIPHVVWDHSDDRKAMQPLFDEFKESGRIIMINDHNCMELKDIIARCRFFIGARTHATIAAYSSCVPTFVLGYSVKARGIAKDIFGTEDHYVIDVQKLKSDIDLVESFQWMQKNEQVIRDHYKKVMPVYIESVHKSRDVIREFL